MKTTILSQSILLVVLILTGTTFANVESSSIPPMSNRTDLALGKKVYFSPQPDYHITMRGGTDRTDLTDGKLSHHKNHRIWFEKSSVGWRELGKFNIAVDLGRQCHINEVAIRLLGGSAQGGLEIPGWIVVVVSNDGIHYHKVAEFSRFKKNEFKKFSIPRSTGKAWVHCLRFKNLDTIGRWVGLRIYSSHYTISDELYVFGKPIKGSISSFPNKKNIPTGFTITHAQPYFHKPYIKIATNIALPVPIGITVPNDMATKQPVTMTLDLPKGIVLAGGYLGDQKVTQVVGKNISQDRKCYVFQAKNLPVSRGARKIFGRLYVRANKWSDGQKGILKYSYSQGSWHSPKLSIPIIAVKVPKAPRLKSIMAGLGWWSSKSSAKWPDVFHTWRVLGLNTSPIFAYYVRDSYPDGTAWQFMRKARKKGFFISNIDAPYHRELRLYKDKKEIHCQLPGGKISKGLCPSYRGKYYHKELKRFARAIARTKPDFSAEDIELFRAYADLDTYKKCSRCQDSFKASGLSSWEKWLPTQGVQMWKGIIKAARQALRQEGANPYFSTGGFRFQAGETYLGVFPFDKLYPDWITTAQPGFYTETYPYNLVVIGDTVRKNRQLLKHSDVMPWLSPGNAGTFPGSAFKWSLLECFANGARGVWFWSGVMWDSEDLIAYNKVIRAIAPVEDVIVKGSLIGDSAKVVGPGRVSGMKLNGKMMLLVADYFHKTDGKVKLKLDIPKNSIVRDLLHGGKKIATLPAGTQNYTVNLRGKSARLLEIEPVNN